MARRRRGALPGETSRGGKGIRTGTPAASPGGRNWGVWIGREPLTASRCPGPTPPSEGAAGSLGDAERVCRPAPGCQRVRETRATSALSSNWVFALCPSFSSSSCLLPPPPTPSLLSTAVRGVSLPACGAGARGPGVQPAAVECLFSKDSEIKKVEFTDSPESRKEAASSKLFPRQHPGATGKAGSEAQAARRSPASGPLGFGYSAPRLGRQTGAPVP